MDAPKVKSSICSRIVDFVQKPFSRPVPPPSTETTIVIDINRHTAHFVLKISCLADTPFRSPNVERCRTSHIRRMVVADIVKVVNFVFVEKQREANCVNWSVSPSFVIKPTGLIQMVKVGFVGFTSKEVQVSDFKVGPKMA